MQNKRWNRIRVGIAAVITSVSFASANTVSVGRVCKTNNARNDNRRTNDTGFYGSD